MWTAIFCCANTTPVTFVKSSSSATGREISDDFPDDFRFHDAREFLVQPAVEVGELSIIEAHEVQHRGVEVADVMFIGDRFVAEFVGLAIGSAAFDPAAGEKV